MVADKRYLADFRRALLNAFWSGVGITDTMIVVVIVLLFAASFFTGMAERLSPPEWLLTAIHESHPPGWLIALMAAMFVIYEFWRTSYRLYAGERSQREQLEKRLVPQLVPEEPHTVMTTMQSGPRAGSQAIYVRVRIRNASAGTAVGCSAKLLEIEFLDERTGWRRLPYKDTLDMSWANKSTIIRELDLAPGNLDTLDIVYAIDGDHELHLATLAWSYHTGMLSLAGEYRFTFLLTCNNAASRTVRLKVHWNFDIKTLRFPRENPLEIFEEKAVGGLTAGGSGPR
jgi:hypothetical protein